MDDQNSDSGELIPFQQWTFSVLNSDSIAEVKGIRDRAEAVRTYARSAAKNLEVQNKAAELRIRAERRAGELLMQLRLRGGNRRSKSPAQHLKLEDLGISRNQSQQWQRIAAVPNGAFECYVQNCRSAHVEITNAGLLRQARAMNSAEKEIDDISRCEQLGGLHRQILQLIADGKQFKCIFVLTPWPKSRQCRQCRSSDENELMQNLIQGLSTLPLADVAAESCHLHLWSTSERLSHAIRLCNHWGFSYQDVLVCRRPSPQWGHYWRVEQDFVLLGAKGNLGFRDNSLSSILESCESSRFEAEKSIRRTIEQVSSPPFLAVFAHSDMPGWLTLHQ